PHPGNFFVDIWLARSNDGAATFADARVSHDSWDPSINPPVSPSGEFIGDYQELVADDCRAVPFVHDTHLANAATRDPNLDPALLPVRAPERASPRTPQRRLPRHRALPVVAAVPREAASRRPPPARSAGPRRGANVHAAGARPPLDPPAPQPPRPAADRQGR